MLKVTQKVSTKTKLSTTLRSWLPILQSNLESLEEVLESFCKENPFMQVRSGCEVSSHTKKNYNTFQSGGSLIESLHVQKKSLYEVLNEQINPPLFPTTKSQEMAYKIIEQINEDGYFEPSEEFVAQNDFVEVDKIRSRFCYLEPSGVGAVDIKESFLFQLVDLEIEEGLYAFVKLLIENFERVQEYKNEKLFNSALSIIKRFHTPPAIEFFEESSECLPDLFVYEKNQNIQIELNDSYYPEILIDTDGVDKNHNFVSQKIKEAKDLVDALEMRKATLYKIGLMIVEYQYDYFKGGVVRPMKLKDLADELERNPSTISRAISNKYLACERGVVPLKQFFSTAIDEETSNSTIKDFLVAQVAKEDKNKPLSDEKILELIEAEFSVKMVRRTITKYRKQLNIPSSSERKKLNCFKH